MLEGVDLGEVDVELLLEVVKGRPWWTGRRVVQGLVPCTSRVLEERSRKDNLELLRGVLERVNLEVLLDIVEVIRESARVAAAVERSGVRKLGCLGLDHRRELRLSSCGAGQVELSLEGVEQSTRSGRGSIVDVLLRGSVVVGHGRAGAFRDDEDLEGCKKVSKEPR